jgi:ligand-binding sensor domain-containing protein
VNIDTGFLKKEAKSFYVESSGKILIGTTKCQIVEFLTGKIQDTFFHTDQPSTENQSVLSIVQDHDGHLWILLSNKNLLECDQVSFAKIKEFIIPSLPTDLVVDDKDIIWIGTESGVYRINKTNTMHRVKKSGQTTAFMQYDNIIIMATLENDGSNVWMLNKEKTSFVNLRLPTRMRGGVITGIDYDQKIKNLIFINSKTIIVYSLCNHDFIENNYSNKLLRCAGLDKIRNLWVGVNNREIMTIPADSLYWRQITCNTEIESSSNGTSQFKCDMKVAPGRFVIKYDMNDVPDKLTILNGRKMDTIYVSTKSFGIDTVKFSSPIIYLDINSEMRKSSTWHFKVGCPTY